MREKEKGMGLRKEAASEQCGNKGIVSLLLVCVREKVFAQVRVYLSLRLTARERGKKHQNQYIVNGAPAIKTRIQTMSGTMRIFRSSVHVNSSSDTMA